MKILHLLLFLLLAFSSLCQVPQNKNVTDSKGLRQGKWTILLDGAATVVSQPEMAATFRLIEYKNDLPIGVVRNYRMNGQLEMETTLIADRPNEIKDGTTSYYGKNGKVSVVRVYAKGKLLKVTAYNLDGSVVNYDFESLKDSASSLQMQSKLELALKTAQAALAQGELQFGKEDVEYANGLNHLGLIYKDLGMLAKAESLVRDALTAYGKNLRDRNYAITAGNLGNIYGDLGIYTKAEQLYLESLAIKKKFVSQYPNSYALTLHNLSWAYVRMGKFSEAKSLEQEAINVIETHGGADTENYASSVDNLALIYRNLGQYSAAEALFLKSFKIREKAASKNPSDLNLAYSQSYLASVYALTGEYSKAERLYVDALKMRGEKLGKEHPLYITSLRNLGTFYANKGDYASAEPLLLEANASVLKRISNSFPSLSEAEKEEFYKSVQGNFEYFDSYCLERVTENPSIVATMYDNQLSTKAVLLNSAVKWKQRIKTSGDKKLFALYTAWEEKRALLLKWQKQAAPIAQRRLDSLDDQTNALEKELSRRSELFASITDKKRTSWTEVKAALKPDEVAIEMIRVRKLGIKEMVVDSINRRRYPVRDLTDTIYYACLLISPLSSLPELILLKNGNALEKRYIKYYNNAIRGQMDDSESYSQFWGPIKKRLDQLKKSTKRITVYFSPEGVYNQLNLNTLYNPATKQFLAEETEIQLVTNTREMVQQKKEEIFNNVAYLFGYPDYQLNAETRAKLVNADINRLTSLYSLTFDRKILLPELPGTKTEVEKISGLLISNGWQPEVLVGDRALEETLKESFKPRVLHIASHGYFQPDSVSVGNPLLHSGLMLAGAAQTLAGNVNDHTEDGILTAYEAMNLNLDNTDLVVLSACETGLGEVRNGEGVYGLQRAFKVAGAKTIIMSLWKVDDKATQLLMTSFYENWLATGNKRQAFHAAQQVLKERYKTPYYWGAFVMVGE